MFRGQAAISIGGRALRGAVLALLALLAVTRAAAPVFAASRSYNGKDLPCTPPHGPRPCPTTAAAAVVGLPVGTVVAASSGVVTSTAAPVVITLSGYVPGSNVVLTAYSRPVRIGVFTADEQGVLRAQVMLPRGLPSGDHHLVAQGRAVGGAPLAQAVAFHFEPPAVRAPAPEVPATPTGATPALLAILVAFAAVGTFAARRRLQTAEIPTTGVNPR